jgi:hypothetical protein
MGLTPSARLRDHVIFHCPSCFADRVGRTRRGGTNAASVFGGADYVECTGCHQPVSACALARGPVGSSFAARMIEAARASAASIVRIGGVTDESLDAAVDYVSTFTTERFGLRSLCADLTDAWLPMRLRGGLILVAETITEEAAISFVGSTAALAATCPAPDAARGVVDECRSLLGLDGRRSLLKRARRR